MGHTKAQARAKPYYCTNCKTRFDGDSTASKGRFDPWAYCPDCGGHLGYRPDGDD